MRTLFFALTFFLFVAGSKSVFAQATNAPAATKPAAHDMGAISFLTQAQQEQYANAREKALEDNPDLQAAGDALKIQAESNPSSITTADFIEKMRSHRQKLRAAMLKEDPTLGPVFTAIDNHISQLKAQEAAGAPSGTGGTNSH